MTACVLPHEQPKPADPPGLTCEPCRRRLRNQCAALPNLANWLQLHIAKARLAGTDPVTGSREAPIPASLDILAMLGPVAVLVHEAEQVDLTPILNINGVVTEWARLVITENEQAGFPATNTLAGISSYLVRHIPWIVQQPWVDEMAAEIAGLHDQARKLAPRFAPRKHLRQVCPSCDTMALVLEHGNVECEVRSGGCGRLWKDGELDWLGHVLAGGAA